MSNIIDGFILPINITQYMTVFQAVKPKRKIAIKALSTFVVLRQ
ncbi:hypothetical protein PTET_a2424 [Pseudoalteromonas tetraodonis]|nr:hypothetical protein PTET_a2424 [Pseudoalteromonas tetraodonis]